MGEMPNQNNLNPLPFVIFASLAVNSTNEKALSCFPGLEGRLKRSNIRLRSLPQPWPAPGKNKVCVKVQPRQTTHAAPRFDRICIPCGIVNIK
jgi:hypothetical protein